MTLTPANGGGPSELTGPLPPLGGRRPFFPALGRVFAHLPGGRHRSGRRFSGLRGRALLGSVVAFPGL